MDGMRFVVPVHVHGTLGANAQGAFRLPCAASLVEISACGSNANDGKLKVGTSADDNGILLATSAIGDSSTPAVWTRTTFDGALTDQVAAPHFADDTIITWLLDYDGDGGTATADFDLLFTFVEG